MCPDKRGENVDSDLRKTARTQNLRRKIYVERIFRNFILPAARRGLDTWLAVTRDNNARGRCDPAQVANARRNQEDIQSATCGT